MRERLLRATTVARVFCIAAAATASAAAGCGGHPATTPTPNGGGPSGNLSRPTRDGDEVDVGHFERLLIGLVGDTRPGHPGADYPTQLITHIYQEMDRRSPDFALTLGDHCFVSPPSHEASAAQMKGYQAARAGYRGTVYYALGNHEGYGGNQQAFRDVLSPAVYYAVRGSVGQRSFKIVFVADDAWNATEEAWFNLQMAEHTDLTFVARHHPSYNAQPSNMHILSLIQHAQVTLLLSGHSHYYRHQSDREVIIGNGGAPLDASNGFYGYATMDIGPDGQIQIEALRESDDAMMDQFTVPPGVGAPTALQAPPRAMN
jgi:predicted phosphodiesterase